MIGRGLAGPFLAVAILGALSLPAARAGAQGIQGPTEPATCVTSFTPASVFTFHGGYAWCFPMLRLLSLVISVSLLSGTGASGQAAPGVPGAASRAPVLVATIDSLLGEPRFRIVRLAGGPVRDVILLPRDADPALLSEAVEALRLIWAHDRNRGDGLATFRLRRMAAESPSRPVLPWAERVITDLRTAPERSVPGVGRGRTLQIWVARPHPAALLP